MLELKNVSKFYDSRHLKTDALNDISLSFPQKGFISIVGPSGCGKTTLLNILGGLDLPSEGTFLIHHIPTHTLSEEKWEYYRNQHVGFIFQHYHLLPHLNVFQNIELPLLIGDKISKEKRIEMVHRTLDVIGLPEKISAYPNELSGGQQQKIAIARALIKSPLVLIADEPTGSLDEASSQEILHLLKEISKDTLVIVVTHQIEKAKIYSDQMIYLKNGCVDHIEKLTENNQKVPDEPTVMPSLRGMRMRSLFKLTSLNLYMRRIQMLLMILIASIGMIGIGLVIASAYGFDSYIENQKRETLNSFPIRVDSFALVVPMINERFQPNMPALPQVSLAYPRNLQYEFVTTNRITALYGNHVRGLDETLYDHIFEDYRLNPPFIHHHQNAYYRIDQGISELDMSIDYVRTHYDILSGGLFTDQPFEIIVVLDKYQRIGKDLMMNLGFSGDEPIDFDTLMGLDLAYIPNNVFYDHNGTNFIQNPLSDSFNHIESIPLQIVGIVRLNNEDLYDLIRPGLYYSNQTTEAIIQLSATSDIVTHQVSSNTHALTNEILTDQQKDTLLRRLGYATYPVAFTIIPASFNQKDAIMDYLLSYNNTVGIFEQVEPLDLAGIGLATVRLALDAITFMLFIFALISLIISNVMIGMMTYHSMQRRIREIGVLRSMGMKKRDIGLLFYFEAVIVGVLAGILALVATYLLIPLLNLFIESSTTLAHIAKLTLPIALLILVVNLILSSMAGWFPAYVASKKNPVECLRYEQ